MPLRPPACNGQGAKNTVVAKHKVQDVPAICKALPGFLNCLLLNKPYCSGYPFWCTNQNVSTKPSQKDNSEKKDCSNR